MKITFAFIIIAITALLIEKGSPITFQKDKTSLCNKGCLWHQGQVPYEISHHFGELLLNILNQLQVYL